MKKVYKSDEFIRLAMLDVYKYKCIYSDNKLEYKDLQIDHIIPKDLKNKKEQLHKILEECGLPSDFELDSLYNLVPTSMAKNNRKSNDILSLNSMIFFLEIAKGKVEAIEKKAEEIRDKRNLDTHLAMVKSKLDEEKEDNREKLLESFFSFVSNESEDFNEKEELYIQDKETVFKKYVKRIGLEAIMPRCDNTETNCVLYFKTLKVRDCMGILDNKTILSEVFKGLFTDPKFGTRGFIEYKKQKHDSGIMNLDTVNIRLGNNRLKLSGEDIYDLCNVIDTYATKYIELINQIEDILKTHKFPLSRRRNNYKFISISYDDWRKLIEFANEHDVDNGKSYWHIFDNNHFYIKIFTNKKHDKYEMGYHAFFHAENSEDAVLYPEFALKQVYITWEFLEDIDNKGINFIDERFNWNAEIAYDWLVNNFIPKVLGRSTFRGLFRKKEKRGNKTNYNNVEMTLSLDKLKSNTLEDIYNIVYLFQVHFYSKPHSRYRISKVDFQGIYNSIIRCLNKSKKADVHYISSKLHLEGCKTTADLINSITQVSNMIEDMTITGFGIDLLFRGLLAALDSKIKLELEDIHYLRENLDYFIKLHDRESLLEKYALDFE